MISRKKLALLYVAKKELEFTDAEYREVLWHHAGVRSSKDLDDKGFKKVIDHMKALGFWVRRTTVKRQPLDAANLPTRPQLQVIEHLWEDLAEYVPMMRNTKARRGFMQKRLGLPAFGPQTRAQANRLIEALKSRVDREMRKKVEAEEAAGVEST